MSPNREAFIIYMATHLSTFKRYRFNIKPPSVTHPDRRSGLFQDEFVSNLKKKMDRCRRDFAIDKKLGHLTSMKTWGLASHNDILASIISLHPSEMVEYTTTAQERSTIVFSYASLEDTPSKPPASFEDLKSKSAATVEENGLKEECTRRRESAKEISFPWEHERTVVPREDAQQSFLKRLTFEPFQLTDPGSNSAIVCFNLVCARFLYENDAKQFLAQIEARLTHQDYAGVVARLTLLHKPNPWNKGTNSPPEAMKLINAIIQITEQHPPAQRQIPVEECMRDCGRCLRWETTESASCTNGHRWRKSPLHLLLCTCVEALCGFTHMLACCTFVSNTDTYCRPFVSTVPIYQQYLQILLPTVTCAKSCLP